MDKRSSGSLFPRRAAGSLVFAAGLLGFIPGALGLDMEEAEQAFNFVCSDCHSTQSVFEGPRLTSQQWDSTVRDMVGRGADATDEELELIRAYLKRSWGSVWINMADAQELVAVMDMPAEEAEKIIAYREENGPFEDLESLKAVPGIDPAMLDAEAGVILFN